MTAKKEIRVNASDEEQSIEGSAEEQTAEEASAKESSTDEAAATGETDTAGGEEVSEVDQLRARVAELDDRLLRVMADFDNYRKRTIRQQGELMQSANDRLLGEMLEVVDNFERALEHAGQAEDAAAVLEGTRLIYGQLKDLLDRHDVTAIEAVGRPFDPNLHEAMMQVESDDFDEGVVALEMGKGYRIGQRVLRHAKVGVSSGRDDAAEEDNQSALTERDGDDTQKA